MNACTETGSLVRSDGFQKKMCSGNSLADADQAIEASRKKKSA
jgi:hypothetical protein